MPENEQLEDVLRRLLAVLSKEDQLNVGVAGGDFSLPEDSSQIQKLNDNLQKIFDPNNEGSFTKKVNELIVKFAEYKSLSENNTKAITESNNKTLTNGFEILNKSVEELNKNFEVERKARLEKEEKEKENRKKEISEQILNKAVEDALAKYDKDIKNEKGLDASELRSKLDTMSVFDKDFEKVLKAAEEATAAQEKYFRKNLDKTTAEIELEEKEAREAKIKSLKEEKVKDNDIQRQIKEAITAANTPIATTAQTSENTNKELIGSTYPVKKLPGYAPSPQEVARDEERQKTALFKVNIVDIDQKAYDKLKDLFEELNSGPAFMAGESGSSTNLYPGPSSRTNRPNPPQPNPPPRVPEPPKPSKPPTSDKPPRPPRVPPGPKVFKAPVPKPPTYVTRAGVAGSLITGAYEGADRYQQTGSVGEAVTVGAGTAGGALAGTLAGAKAGALLGGLAGPGAIFASPILATIGGLIGGIAGVWAGKKGAEAAINAFAESGGASLETDSENTPLKIVPGETDNVDIETTSSVETENQPQENKELEAFNKGFIQGQTTLVNNTITETITENNTNTSEALDKMAAAAERINESVQKLEAQMTETLKTNTATAASNSTTVMQGGNKIDLYLTPPDIQQNRLESIEKLSGNR
jgi:hypothetical protein